jgi:hypothetical protein
MAMNLRSDGKPRHISVNTPSAILVFSLAFCVLALLGTTDEGDKADMKSTKLQESSATDAATNNVPERASRRSFKGMELYSWKDAKGEWVFALVLGTNRLKTESEIKKKENQILGTKELEKHFLQLAEGEQVLWFHRKPKGFAYPDENLIAEIADSAKKAKIELHFPPTITPSPERGSKW